MTDKEIKKRIEKIEKTIFEKLSFGVLDPEIMDLQKEKTEIQEKCSHKRTVEINGQIICDICHKNL